MVMRQLLNIIFLILISYPVHAQLENDHYLAGLAGLHRKEFKQAVSEFDKAIELESNRYHFYLKRGEAYFWLGEYLKAKDDFNEASRLERYSGSLGLAMTYAKIGDTDPAISHLEDHLGSHFRVSEKKIKLNNAFESIENSRKWVELWKKRWYNSFEELETEVDFLIKTGQYREALDLIEIYISKYPEKAEAYAIKGRIKYNRGKMQEAINNFNEAVLLDPGNPGFKKSRAEVYIKSGNLIMAVKDISNALGYDPSMFDLYITRAGLYRQMDAADKALDDLTRYLDYFPADDEALRLCGNIYIDQEKYYSALECFSINVVNHPEKPESFIDRADAYVLTGTYKYAIRDYGMALDLDPTDPETWLNRGLAYIKTGDNKNGCYDFIRSVRLKSREGVRLYKEYCE